MKKQTKQTIDLTKPHVFQLDKMTESLIKSYCICQLPEGNPLHIKDQFSDVGKKVIKQTKQKEWEKEEFYQLTIELQKWFKLRDIDLGNLIGQLAVFIQNKLAHRDKELIEKIEKLKRNPYYPIPANTREMDANQPIYEWNSVLDKVFDLIKQR